MLLRKEEQKTISIDYRNIIKDLLLLRKEEQKTISIDYNITIVLLPYVRLQKYIHFAHTYLYFLLLNVQDQKIYNKKQYKEKSAKIKSHRQIQKCLI